MKRKTADELHAGVDKARADLDDCIARREAAMRHPFVWCLKMACLKLRGWLRRRCIANGP